MTRLMMLGATALSAVPGLVLAQTAPTVTAGSATITQTLGKTVIDQTSNRAAIDWKQFGVRAGEALQINQPTSGSVSLQRVTGGEISRIDGTLSSNGQVWLSNPNGVIVGQGGAVNVGGLLATTGRVDVDRLMARGEAAISGATGAPISIEGLVRAGGGGVTLVGRDVIVSAAGAVQTVGAVNVGAGAGAVVLPAGAFIPYAGGGGYAESVVTMTVDPGTAAKIAALGPLSGSRIVISAPGGTAEIGENALGSNVLQSGVARGGPDAYADGIVIESDRSVAASPWWAQARNLKVAGQVQPVVQSLVQGSVQPAAPVLSTPVAPQAAAASVAVSPASYAVPGHEAQLAAAIAAIMASYTPESSLYKRRAEDR